MDTIQRCAIILTVLYWIYLVAILLGAVYLVRQHFKEIKRYKTKINNVYN